MLKDCTIYFSKDHRRKKTTKWPMSYGVLLCDFKLRLLDIQEAWIPRKSESFIDDWHAHIAGKLFIVDSHELWKSDNIHFQMYGQINFVRTPQAAEPDSYGGKPMWHIRRLLITHETIDSWRVDK